MGKNARRIAAVASGLLLAVGGATAGSAAAADGTPTTGDRPTLKSCYGVIHAYRKASGTHYYPSGGADLTTTSRCADINILPNQSRYVAVCFKPSSGSEYCNGWTYAVAGRWTVVASDVRDGTRFYFEFSSTAAASGGWAA